ncbi:carboxylesterase [Aspergillus lentulus]|nr:carboxylesterase [Aspergillus lentulus]
MYKSSLPVVFGIVAGLIFSVPCAAVSPQARWTIGQTVQTSSGPVRGHAAPHASNVSEYLAIPYALPPVGNLRFQPPVRYRGNTTISGETFGPACISSNLTAYDDRLPDKLIEQYGVTSVGQKFLAEIGHPNVTFSEDCLTLNVWTKPQTGEKKKAVMIWVHGGSFVSGSSAIPMYNGQFFADQEDIVLVSINYRLSFFGFPGNSPSSFNLGLLDQRLAVEWVRDNIAAFSGDPSRITLFGESAGGTSVDHYSYAWKDDPIVHALIVQSGNVARIGGRTAEQARTLWLNASEALGCGNQSTHDQQIYDCMITKPAGDIARHLVNTMATTVNLPYSPAAGDILVFSNYADRPAAAVPMLVGTTDFENGLFRVYVDEPLPDDAWIQQNQALFNCPVAARANISVQQGNPTWRYRYFGEFPNMMLSTKAPSGAYHSSEVPVLFDTVAQDLIPNTAEEVAIGRYMRGAWAAFARDPVSGLERYDGWPQYEAGEETLIRLGFNNRTGPNLAMGNLYDKGC